MRGAILEMTGPLLNARQLADRYGHHPETILRWVRQGKLPRWCWTRPPSGAIRFYKDAIERLEEEWATTKRGSASHPVSRRPAGNLAVASHPIREED
jgi:helix-turn-helix protein